MKKTYIHPQTCWEEAFPRYVLAASSLVDASGEDIVFEGESDFDSFFS